jgi:hypothetical protein
MVIMVDLLNTIRHETLKKPRKFNRGRRLAGTSFAHHPRIEKQGV